MGKGVLKKAKAGQEDGAWRTEGGDQGRKMVLLVKNGQARAGQGQDRGVGAIWRRRAQGCNCLCPCNGNGNDEPAGVQELFPPLGLPLVCFCCLSVRLAFRHALRRAFRRADELQLGIPWVPPSGAWPVALALSRCPGLLEQLKDEGKRKKKKSSKRAAARTHAAQSGHYKPPRSGLVARLWQRLANRAPIVRPMRKYAPSG